MDTTSSPQKIESSLVEKRRPGEGVSVASEQMRAVERLRGMPVRHFRLEAVAMSTVSGEPLVARMWTTCEELSESLKSKKEVFECEFCHKLFDKRQKMLLHARFHSKH